MHVIEIIQRELAISDAEAAEIDAALSTMLTDEELEEIGRSCEGRIIYSTRPACNSEAAS